jgi:hypothetical protein
MLGGSVVITAWHVLRLWMEETASGYGAAAANTLNKQLWTADKGWFSSFGVGHELTTPQKIRIL